MALSQFHSQRLIEAWTKGMKHSDSPLVSEVAETSGLSITQVKNWIGNYRRKTSGKPATKKRVRQPSGYNLFCREMAKKSDKRLETCSKEWSRAWALLSDLQKDSYKEKAEKELTVLSDADKVKKYLKQMSVVFQNLNALGVEGFSVLRKPGASGLHFLGSNKGLPYILANEDLIKDFSSSIDKQEAPSKSNKERESLRKEVQDLFNKKYRELHGASSKLSYKKAVVVEGLPSGIAFKKPSCYGLKSLKAILAGAKDLKFKMMDGHSQDAEPSARDSVAENAEQEHGTNHVVTVEVHSKPNFTIERENTELRVNLHRLDDEQFLQHEAEKVLSEMASGSLELGTCDEFSVPATPITDVLSAMAIPDIHAKKSRKRKAENQRKILPVKREKASKTMKGK